MVVMFLGFGLGFFDDSGSNNNTTNIFSISDVVSKLYLRTGLSDYTCLLFNCSICHVLSGAGNHV